jgi:hypothetical protein
MTTPKRLCPSPSSRPVAPIPTHPRHVNWYLTGESRSLIRPPHLKVTPTSLSRRTPRLPSLAPSNAVSVTRQGKLRLVKWFATMSSRNKSQSTPPTLQHITRPLPSLPPLLSFQRTDSSHS